MRVITTGVMHVTVAALTEQAITGSRIRGLFLRHGKLLFLCKHGTVVLLNFLKDSDCKVTIRFECIHHCNLIPLAIEVF